jgi:hypothetical protein
MAVCKRCGCAIPLGSKNCDMCATTAAIAPAQAIPSWRPPAAVASNQPAVDSPPTAQASSQPAASTTPPMAIARGAKQVRFAWRFLLYIGIAYIVLGALTEFGYLDDYQSLFGSWAIAIGAAFLICAYFVRQGSIVALAAAVLIYGLYTLAFLAAGAAVTVIIRALIWIRLLQSLIAMNTLRQYRRSGAQQPPANDQNRAA